MPPEDAAVDPGVTGVTHPAFEPVIQAAAVLRAFPRPWYVAGGWAIDLFLGTPTREHEDVDIAILRTDQAVLRDHLATWTFEKVVDGKRVPWAQGDWLEPPLHEVHASRVDGSPSHLEILLNESSDAEWRFRRNPAVVRPLDRIGLLTAPGIPFLAPEVVLLFKAKAPAGKDVHDFEAVRLRMMPEPREWLRGALEASHPGHPWLSRLAPPPRSQGGETSGPIRFPASLDAHDFERLRDLLQLLPAHDPGRHRHEEDLLA